MLRKEGSPYQLHLGEKIPETLYRFDKGTVIYPLDSRQGVLRDSIFAEKTDRKDRGGLIVYKSKTPIDLYFDRRFWSLPEGTLFGAYSKQAHKVKIE
jgi:hypothetical protein